MNTFVLPLGGDVGVTSNALGSLSAPGPDLGERNFLPPRHGLVAPAISLHRDFYGTRRAPAIGR